MRIIQAITSNLHVPNFIVGVKGEMLPYKTPVLYVKILAVAKTAIFAVNTVKTVLNYLKECVKYTSCYIKFTCAQHKCQC